MLCLIDEPKMFYENSNNKCRKSSKMHLIWIKVRSEIRYENQVQEVGSMLGGGFRNGY